LFEIANIADEVKSIIGDVRDIESLNSVFQDFKPEIVFHLAAQPIVRESYKNPVYTYETNVMGTVNLLECIRNCESVKSVLNV
jgi:CDP-glucose 4,6-dehydratase